MVKQDEKQREVDALLDQLLAGLSPEEVMGREGLMHSRNGRSRKRVKTGTAEVEGTHRLGPNSREDSWGALPCASCGGGEQSLDFRCAPLYRDHNVRTRRSTK